MSSTEQQTGSRTSGDSTTGDADDTQQLQRAEGGADPGGRRSGSSGAQGSMRDGAMARVAPRRNPSERRQGTGRTGGSGEAGSPGSAGAAAATAGRGRPTEADRSTPRSGAAARSGSAGRPGRRTVGPRRVRLAVQRVDPWSVMKISFLVSVALGIAGVVMVTVLWTVLAGMNVFATLNEFITQVTSGEDNAASFDLMEYVGLGRVAALSTVFGVVNVILLTALATLTAFLYNICSALVGGFHLTLSDE